MHNGYYLIVGQWCCSSNFGLKFTVHELLALTVEFINGYSRSMLQYFRQSVEGNLAVITALSLTLIGVAAGGAVDYANQQKVQKTLQSAADAATLAAVSYARSHVQSGSLSAETVIKEQAKDHAFKIWNADAAGQGEATFDISVERVDGAWKATASFNKQVPTALLQLGGINYLPAKGTAVATTGIDGGSHLSLYILGDVSASMLMGSTQAEMDKINSTDGSACGFACHYTTDETPGSYVWAKKSGIKLRLDGVNDAIASLMNTLPRSSNIKVSLYKFSTTLEKVEDPTSDYSRISDAKLEPALIAESKGETFIPEVLNDFATEVGDSGAGLSSSDPKKVVVMITDGIADKPFYYAGGEPMVNNGGQAALHEYLAGMETGDCQKLKDNGVELAIVLTKYYPPAGWDLHLQPRMDEFMQKAKACASDGLFAYTDSAADVETALKDLADKAMSRVKGPVRLTQ